MVQNFHKGHYPLRPYVIGRLEKVTQTSARRRRRHTVVNSTEHPNIIFKIIPTPHRPLSENMCDERGERKSTKRYKSIRGSPRIFIVILSPLAARIYADGRLSSENGIEGVKGVIND